MTRSAESAISALALAALLVIVPAVAKAQTNDTPTKVPPSPLFPKHRRGIYRNPSNEEVIDATPQSPPLQVDDPSVPDNGEWEINIGTDADFGLEERRANFLFVDANYGMLPTIMGQRFPMQVKAEFPLAGLKEHGAPIQLGVGRAAVGLKVNFFQNENAGFSLALYPQVEMSSHGSAEKGLAEPGQTFVLPVLVLKETTVATLVFNAGIEKPIGDPERQAASTFGVGVGRPLTRKLAAMVDLYAERPLHLGGSASVDVDAGVIYGVRNVPVYAKVGRSLHSDDGGHTYLALGGKLILPARH